MGAFWDEIKDDVEAAGEKSLGDDGASFGSEGAVYAKRGGIVHFGAEYDGDTTVVANVQAKVNAMGYTPALKVDGQYGPLTQAGVKWAQTKLGISSDGIIGDQTLAAMKLSASAPAPTSSGGKPASPGTTGTTSAAVKISTVVAALRQAAQEKGYTLSDTLLSLMIGQLRGAEGAYPGVHSSLGGTNNMGAAQVSKSLYTAKQGMTGWGGFAHYDSDPDKGGYLGWYYIAPSPLESARHWFGDNWWGPRLAQANPQDATSYAAILYQGGYYGGEVPHGSDGNDPNSPSGQKNVAAYATNIQRGIASAAEMAVPPDDPAALTVDPTQFQSLTARKLTEALFDKAKGGGLGSAWGYLLPATWDEFVANNGVVWFGPVPGQTALDKVKTYVAANKKKLGIGAAALALLAAIGTGIAMMSGGQRA